MMLRRCASDDHAQHAVRRGAGFAVEAEGGYRGSTRWGWRPWVATGAR